MAKHKPRPNRDHAHQKQRPDASDEVIAKQLEELLTPAIDAQASHYKRLGLRARILTLPLMVAAVLTLLWRDVPSVRELTRMLAREDLLWCKAVKVSAQSLGQRFLEFPAELFERVFFELLPHLKQRWHQRQNHPLPESIQKAREQFEQIWLYRRRWRIEQAFSTVKRLLGLSYLWTGSINGVKLQPWATWLFFAVLVDLGDAVADELGVPFEQISLEML